MWRRMSKVSAALSRRSSRIRSSSQMVALLGFGLRHVYQVEGGRGLEHVYGLLKGSDTTVYRAVLVLGFEPVLYLYYESQPTDNKFVETGLIHRVTQPEGCEEVESFISTLLDYCGFVLRLMDAYGCALGIPCASVRWVKGWRIQPSRN
jgi:hypothetical protein